MKANNNKKQTRNPKLGLFKMMLATLMLQGMSDDKANKNAFHTVFMGGGNPEFHPRKHTKMSYSAQNRLAKKRRKSKLKK